jgi:hypothetical protein
MSPIRPSPTWTSPEGDPPPGGPDTWVTAPPPSADAPVGGNPQTERGVRYTPG